MASHRFLLPVFCCQFSFLLENHQEHPFPDSDNLNNAQKTLFVIAIISAEICNENGSFSSECMSVYHLLLDQSGGSIYSMLRYKN